MKFSEFLQLYGFYIALTIFGLIIIILVIFLFIPRLKSEPAVRDEEDLISKNEFLDLLGGAANIKVVTLNGSRLSVELSDQSVANVEELKKHGVDRVIVMQNKLVLLIDRNIKNLFNELL